jgi:hypothetical protein
MNNDMPPPPRRTWSDLVARARPDSAPAIDVSAQVRAAIAREPGLRTAAKPPASATGWSEFVRLFGQPRGLAACGLGTLAAAACAAALFQASTAHLDPFMRLIFFGTLAVSTPFPPS